MKRLLAIVGILVAVPLWVAAAIDVTPTAVNVQNMTVDKTNYFVTVEAYVNNSEYEIAFDVWPSQSSIVGQFSAADRTIAYVNSYVCKVRYNGAPLGTMYYCEQSSKIELSITSNGDGTCTLSGSTDAFASNGTMYTYVIAPIVFAYDDQGDGPTEQDPYRFEPEQAGEISFSADVVDIRYNAKSQRLNITLNELANETYNWLELSLITDEWALPAGQYEVTDSGDNMTLTASRGYLGVQNDDPCYLAIREEEMWGAYTPYYIVSGALTVSYNHKTDSVFVRGEVVSHNGTRIQVDARSYNMLYVPGDEPREPEKVTLAIDSVVVTYMREQSSAHEHKYTMNFFGSADGYPNVITDVILPDSMRLTAGRYTLADSTLQGVTLFQNQSDFNEWFFGGEPYEWVNVELTLNAQKEGQWAFSMLMQDTIGSEYRFELVQAPHIINYPVDEEEIDPKDKPYADELREATDVEVLFDSIQWIDATVAKDGVLDILLIEREGDTEGLRYMAQLGFYTPVSDVPSGTYEVTDSEEDYTFSASLGRYGNVVIPCYLAIVDEQGWAHRMWYIVQGSIRVDRAADGAHVLEGECQSYFGSSIRFSYNLSTDVSITTTASAVRKVIHNGQLWIEHDGRWFDVLGVRK